MGANSINQNLIIMLSLNTSLRYHLVKNGFMDHSKYIEILECPKERNNKGKMIVASSGISSEAIFKIVGNTFVFEQVPYTMTALSCEHFKMQMGDVTLDFILSDPDEFEEEYYCDPVWEMGEFLEIETVEC